MNKKESNINPGISRPEPPPAPPKPPSGRNCLELSSEDVLNLLDIIKSHIKQIDRRIEECAYHVSSDSCYIPKRDKAIELLERIKNQAGV